MFSILYHSSFFFFFRGVFKKSILLCIMNETCVILPIEFKYINLILSGKKKIELRKKIWKRTGIQKVKMYQTKSHGLIVGEFTIDFIEEESPLRIWEKSSDVLGIDKHSFDTYFQDRTKAFAIHIKNPIEYDCPIQYQGKPIQFFKYE